MLEALLPIEQALLEALLAGELPLLESLRVQLAASDVSDREYTGSGFFTRFSVPPHVPRVLPDSFRLGDVWFGLLSNEDGGEAILWVKEGALDSLEAFARDGAWPQNAQLDGVHYFGEARDLDALRSLAGG